MNRSFSSLAALRERISDWWVRHMTMRELNQCDERDLKRILHDLHVTKPELNDVVTRGAYPKLLLPEMLQVHDLGPERLKVEHPAVEADLRRVCAQCTQTRRCRHELEAQTAASGHREFCNNSTTIEALLAEAAGEAKTQKQSRNYAASGSSTEMG
jgi:uncharacterized protein YjiS (DUF1127 family)